MKTVWAIVALLATGVLILGIAWIFVGSNAAKRARGVAAGLVFGTLVLAMAWVFYFQDQPLFVKLRRPANVPKDAVYVLMVKGIWWVHCEYNPQGDFDHCEVWNEGGGVIDEGTYLPYDGGPAVKEDQLKIQKGANPIMGNAICLENGRALLPKWLVDRHNEGSSQEFFYPGCPKVGAGASR